MITGSTTASTTNDATTRPNWRHNGPFEGSYAGNYSGFFDGTGINGFYLSSTVTAVTTTRGFYVGYLNVNVGTNSSDKINGQPIRCIF